MVIQSEKCKIIPLGSRVFAFSFYEDFMGDTTYSYVIIGEKHVFIIDTFLGPNSMGEIKQFLKEKSYQNKSIILILTHAHWDHYWGNCAFPNSLIISHKTSYEIMQNDALRELESKIDWTQGDVEIIYPNFLFEKNINFTEEQIELFWSPGHTRDSISIYDKQDHILFLGDNVEDPFPYVNGGNFDQYIATLQSYLSLDAKIYAIGHGNIHYNSNLIQENIEYLQHFENLTWNYSAFSEKQKALHVVNLFTVGKTLNDLGNMDLAMKYLQECKTLLIDRKDEFGLTKLKEIEKILWE